MESIIKPGRHYQKIFAEHWFNDFPLEFYLIMTRKMTICLLLP